MIKILNVQNVSETSISKRWLEKAETDVNIEFTSFLKTKPLSLPHTGLVNLSDQSSLRFYTNILPRFKHILSLPMDSPDFQKVIIENVIALEEEYTKTFSISRYVDYRFHKYIYNIFTKLPR